TTSVRRIGYGAPFWRQPDQAGRRGCKAVLASRQSIPVQESARKRGGFLLFFPLQQHCPWLCQKRAPSGGRECHLLADRRPTARKQSLNHWGRCNGTRAHETAREEKSTSQGRR